MLFRYGCSRLHSQQLCITRRFWVKMLGARVWCPGQVKTWREHIEMSAKRFEARARSTTQPALRNARHPSICGKIQSRPVVFVTNSHRFSLVEDTDVQILNDTVKINLSSPAAAQAIASTSKTFGWLRLNSVSLCQNLHHSRQNGAIYKLVLAMLAEKALETSLTSRITACSKAVFFKGGKHH